MEIEQSLQNLELGPDFTDFFDILCHDLKKGELKSGPENYQRIFSLIHMFEKEFPRSVAERISHVLSEVIDNDANNRIIDIADNYTEAEEHISNNYENPDELTKKANFDQSLKNYCKIIWALGKFESLVIFSYP